MTDDTHTQTDSAGGSMESSPTDSARLSGIGRLLEASHVAFGIGSADGRIIYHNRALERLTGYSPEELDDLDWAVDLTPEEWREAEAGALARLVETGEPVVYEKEYIRKDGSRVPIELVVHVEYDGDRRPACFYSFLTDLTARKAAEARSERRQRFSDSLNRVLQTINSSMDPHAVLESVVEESLSAMGADYSLIVELTDDWWVVSHTFGEGGEQRGTRRYRYGERPVILDALESGEIQVVDDAMSHPRTNKDIMARYSIGSFAAAPLVLRDRTLGILEVVRSGGPRPFDAESIEFLENISRAVSLAVDRMLESERDHVVADTLQRALLEIPDEVPGVHCERRYRAATEYTLVGGDLYDVFARPDGQIAMAIGDVSGKGPRAAALTAMVRDVMRTCALDGMTVAETVAKVNRVLAYFTPIEMFTTLFAGQLDPVTGDLTYVNGGHPAPYVMRGDGSVETLPGADPIVGAFASVGFNEHRTILGRDDLLLLYTDGVIEARRGSELYGEQRLLAVLRESHGSPAELLDALLVSVDSFSQGHLRDDIAILAIGRTP